MFVEIRRVEMKEKYVSSGPNVIEDPRLRVVTVVSLQPDGSMSNQELKFTLPAIEVDGQILVGSVYEMVFSRRERPKPEPPF